MFRLTLNGLLPNEVIDSLCRWVANVINMAETEAEERMQKKAIKAFCAANCPKGCSFGADGNIGCGAKANFTLKLNADDND